MHLNLLAHLLLARGAPIESSDPVSIDSQPRAKHPDKSDEVRHLQWGELNFLHTTDTHGWLAGHILEREFSGDWGDFVSFQERMREIADREQVDLITVDTGDRHDGNGLSDASKHDGSLSLPVFCEVDYDVVTIGNHELYRGVASLQEFHKIRSRFGDRYVVSNVELAVGKAWVPMGEKYRIFQTKNQNFTVLALGFLFNFEGNDKDASRVTKVEDEIEKDWFAEVMQKLPEIDYVLVVGHIPPRGSPEFGSILNKIRSYDATIPVSMVGGHSHIRDYKIYDDYAVALQSGRYVETLGWSSVNFTNSEQNGEAKLPSFSRSYIDFNERNMALHAERDLDTFKTGHGIGVSKWIARIREQLNLDEYRATIPQNYYTDRAPFPSSNSVYSLVQEHALPLLTSPDEVKNDTRYILFNTGGIRFDLFKGPFTKDTGYIMSPFRNEWIYIKDVPKWVADEVLPLINGEDKVLASKSRYNGKPATPEHENSKPKGWLDIMCQALIDLLPSELRFWQPPTTSKHLSAGYKTEDDLDSVGDDTVHEPWKFYPIPNALQSIVPPPSGAAATKSDEPVTLIFHDFMAYFVQRALNALKEPELFKPIYHGGEDIIDLVPAYFNQLEAAQSRRERTLEAIMELAE